MATNNSPEGGHLKYRKEDLRRSAVFALGTFDNSFLLRPVQVVTGVELSNEANLRAKVFLEDNPVLTTKDAFGASIFESPEERGRRRFAGMFWASARSLTWEVGALLGGKALPYEVIDEKNRRMFEEDPSAISMIRFRLDESRERAGIATLDSAKKIPEVTLSYLAEDLEPVKPGPNDDKIRQTFEELELLQEQRDVVGDIVEKFIERGNEINREFRVRLKREILLDDNGMTIAPDGSIVPADVLRYIAKKSVYDRYEKAVWTYLLDFAEAPSK